MKTLQIVNNLSNPDKRRVKEALISPFFNKNEKLVQAWDVLVNAKEESPTELKLLIHKVIFQKDKYDDLVIRHLLSKLHKLLEEIIGVLKLQDDPQNISLAYSQWLNDHELQNLHDQQINILSFDTPQKTNDYFWHYQWFMELEHLSRKTEANYEHSLMPIISDNFDQYYIVNRLKITCQAYSLFISPLTKSAFGLLEKIAMGFERREPEEPLLLMYYLSLQTFRSENGKTYFNRLKLALPLPSLPIADTERLELFDLALSYCIKMVKQGNLDYLEDIYDLYESMLELSLIQHNETHFPRILKKLVAIMLRLNASNWATKLIATHIAQLKIENSLDYESYNSAQIYFELQNFQATLDQLQKVTFNESSIGIRAKILVLKTYFELKQMESVVLQIEALKSLLKNKNTPYSDKQNSQAFLKYMQLLINLESDDKGIKKLLYSQIKADEELIESDWFLKKLDSF
jgi:hypothetical protein